MVNGTLPRGGRFACLHRRKDIDGGSRSGLRLRGAIIHSCATEQHNLPIQATPMIAIRNDLILVERSLIACSAILWHIVMPPNAAERPTKDA